MFRRLRPAIAGLALSAVASSLAVPAFADNWNLYNHQSAPQFATSVGARELAQKITEATGGKVKVRLHLASTLQIPTSDITSAVADNIVQMGDDLFFAGNVPIGSILKLPFLVHSYEEFDKASAILQPYVEKGYADKGVVLLAGYAYPMQYIWGRKSFDSLASVKGAKLRVASPEQSEFVRHFGGSSVTIGASEVPSALDRGVVDGIVTGTVGAELWKDMLSSGYLLGLNYNNAYFIANANAFNALSPEDQGKIRKAAQEVAEKNTSSMKADDGKLIESLGAGKLKLTKPTDADLAKASAEMQPYWESWAKAHGPEAEEALAKIRQALGR